VLILAWSPRALALNPSLDVNQYAHTAWKTRDGFAKGLIYAIAQTNDGYLWLGTDVGLFHFDGVKVARWESANQKLPSENVWSLLAARDGTLWIGTTRGLVRWNGRTLARYEEMDGRRIGPLVEDDDGVVWIGSERDDVGWLSTCRVERDRLQCGGPDASVVSLFKDSRGTVWAGTLDRRVWRLKPGPAVFYRLPSDLADVHALSEDADGSLLIATSGGITRLADGRIDMKLPLPSSMPSATARVILRDRDHGLWIGTMTSGLLHVHEGITDVYSQADGLSGDQVSNVFEDVEGNIWVATSGGLDRFREGAGATVTVRQGLSNSRVSALAPSMDGSVWATSIGAVLNFRNGETTIYRERSESLMRRSLFPDGRLAREVSAGWADHPTAVFQDRRGRTWVAVRRGVGYLENDRLVSIEGLPGGSTRAIVEDSERLWVVNDEAGVFGVSPDGRGVTPLPRATLSRQDPITAAAADASRKGVWLGFMNGGVVFIVDGRVQASYDTSKGLGAGTVRQLFADEDATLWAATARGVSRLKDGHVSTLTRENGLPCDMILWLVQDNDRALWVTSPCGVTRITRDEIGRWIERGGSVRLTTFDDADGVRTPGDFFPYTAPTVKSADGRLWFISPDGLGVVDPRRLAINPRPPPVYIEHVVADRKAYETASPSGEAIQLPALVRDLEIDYIALSLVAPEKNQFRYQLEGYDRDWQDAGNRRQAFYTNLRPGRYRFRVIASNNSGVWNEAGAARDFSIAPAYYQTKWFLALSAAIVGAVVWAAHRVRLRIVERHEGEIRALNERLMKAQEQERIRIAGELHDGVMQQMLAVTMMLGTAKRKAAGNEEAQASIDKIQHKVIQAGTEIRQLSHGLHPPQLQDAGLPGALRSYCEQFGAASSILVACDIDERARDLSRGAALALFRITQEALGNAAKHAKAKHISVRLARTNGSVALTVSDDGVGFDRGRLGTSGGLGLVMMRERAGQLNGTFEFDSAPGRGTTITVAIPFR